MFTVVLSIPRDEESVVRTGSAAGEGVLAWVFWLVWLAWGAGGPPAGAGFTASSRFHITLSTYPEGLTSQGVPF
jgi:hypothetical protein